MVRGDHDGRVASGSGHPRRARRHRRTPPPPHPRPHTGLPAHRQTPQRKTTDTPTLRVRGVRHVSRHDICGAGGNRTPVRQVVTEPATTIPALRPRGLPHRRVGGPHEEVTPGSFPGASGLSRRQWSFPTVHPRFCCRAAVIRPRAPSLVTILLFYLLIRSGGESELLIVGGSFGAPV